MDELLTDDQEVDRAKKWLSENGTFLVAGVVLGLGGLFGWQQWENSKLAHAGEASVVWEQMQTALAGDRLNEVLETLEILNADYADTPYMDQARLAVARMYMDRTEPQEAAQQLQLLRDSSRDEQIVRVAELRLAQVLLYQQQAQEALDVLGDGRESAFSGQYHELRGDAYFALGQLEQARDAYLAALATTADGVINRDFVSLKLEDTNGMIAATASEVSTDTPAASAPVPDEQGDADEAS